MWAHLCHTDWFSIPVCDINMMWHITQKHLQCFGAADTPWSRRPDSVSDSTHPLFLTWRRRDSPAAAIFLYSRVMQKTDLIKSINLNNLLLPALQRQFFPALISPCTFSSLPCRDSCKGQLGTLFFRALTPSPLSQSPPYSSVSLFSAIDDRVLHLHVFGWKCHFSLFGLTDRKSVV